MKEIEIHIEVTNECILKCKHCSSIANSNPEKIKFNEVIEFIKRFTNTHKIRLILTGGEPLLRGELGSFLEEISKINKDIEIGLFTTGLVKQNNSIENIAVENIKKLKNLGVKFVFISVYSNKSEIHDSITQVKSSFEKTIKAIKMFNEEGIETNINLVLMNKNIIQLNEIICFLKNIKINEIRVLRLINHGIASDNWSDIGVTKEEQLEAIRNIEEPSDIKISFGGFLEVKSCQYLTNDKKCLAGKNKLYIDNKGDIYPCGAVKLNPHIKLCNINQDFNNYSYNNQRNLCMAY